MKGDDPQMPWAELFAHLSELILDLTLEGLTLFSQESMALILDNVIDMFVFVGTRSFFLH